MPHGSMLRMNRRVSPNDFDHMNGDTDQSRMILAPSISIQPNYLTHNPFSPNQTKISQDKTT